MVMGHEPWKTFHFGRKLSSVGHSKCVSVAGLWLKMRSYFAISFKKKNVKSVCV